jgi:protein SCO1
MTSAFFQERETRNHIPSNGKPRRESRLPRPTARRHFLLASLGVVLSVGVFAHDNKMDMNGHEHHHAAVDTNGTVKRSEADYLVPDLKLVRNDGAVTQFPKEIDDGRPVILDFIYTSCTDICPMTSLVFSQVQKKLAKDIGKVHLVSISIDPEYDTPERLTAYARRYSASPQWQHYTGTIEASVAMQKAFGAYRGDKMNHTPITYIRLAPGKPWVRLDGFANPDDIIRELPLLASNQ